MLRDSRPSGPLGRLFGPARNRRVRLSASRPAASSSARGRALLRALGCVALSVGLGGAAYGFRGLLYASPRFALTTVRLGPLVHLDGDQLIERSGIVLGHSLFALDLTTAERRIAREPWVQRVRVRRELPHAVAIDVTEREARLAVALGAIYLVDRDGTPFKRARGDELVGVPIVTGIGRERYLADPARGRAILRRAEELDAAWRARGLPAPGELYHDGGQDLAAAFTVYFPHGGRTVAARVGVPDASLPERLIRLVAVLAALDARGERAELIHLDLGAKLDRVAVRLVGMDTPNASGAPDGADTEAL